MVASAAGAIRRCCLHPSRIAIAALNPHCGEGGIFGRHDIDGTQGLDRAHGQIVAMTDRGGDHPQAAWLNG